MGKKGISEGKDVTDIVIDKLVKNLPDEEAESVKILGMIQMDISITITIKKVYYQTLRRVQRPEER